MPLDPQDQAQGVGLVIKQTNVAFIKEIEAAVQILKSTGVIEKLEKKWDIPS